MSELEDIASTAVHGAVCLGLVTLGVACEVVKVGGGIVETAIKTAGDVVTNAMGNSSKNGDNDVTIN